MTYAEILEAARPLMGKVCKACPVCNGRACGNKIPGPGAKGMGDTAIRNFDAWQAIRVNMDTICGHEVPRHLPGAVRQKLPVSLLRRPHRGGE